MSSFALHREGLSTQHGSGLIEQRSSTLLEERSGVWMPFMAHRPGLLSPDGVLHLDTIDEEGWETPSSSGTSSCTLDWSTDRDDQEVSTQVSTNLSHFGRECFTGVQGTPYWCRRLFVAEWVTTKCLASTEFLSLLRAHLAPRTAKIWGSRAWRSDNPCDQGGCYRVMVLLDEPYNGDEGREECFSSLFPPELAPDRGFDSSASGGVLWSPSCVDSNLVTAVAGWKLSVMNFGNLTFGDQIIADNLVAASRSGG